MRLGIDIDGTIGEFVGGLAVFAREAGFTVDENQYDLGLQRNDYLDLYDLMVDAEAYLILKPYEGVQNCLARWVAEGHQITYITRRRPGRHSEPRAYSVQSQTFIWLHRNNFPSWNNVIFTQDKASVCYEQNIPVLIDDYLPDCLKHYGLMKNRQNFYAILQDRPWNQGDFPRRIKYLQEAAQFFGG